MVRYGLSRLDLEPDDSKRRKAAAAAVLQRIDRREREKDNGDDGSTDFGEAPRRSRKENLVLNQYEQTIASEVVAPEDIAVSFNGRILSIKDSQD